MRIGGQFDELGELLELADHPRYEATGELNSSSHISQPLTRSVREGRLPASFHSLEGGREGMQVG